MPPVDPPLNYRSAGVDVEAGDALVDAIKPIAARTHREGVVDGLGGFGALFEIPKKYQRPLLVSGTDGVGTKLKLAFELNRHDTIGIDLVAMCANDVLVQGAEPLFFLDYFATGRLSPEVAVEVIRGIGAGCEQAGAALIGGETAEMPGMYTGGEYDLAGFCVGAVEKDALIDGSSVRPGDAVVGLASSGPHSNGYSLIRKVIETGGLALDAPFEDETVGDHLLRPTRIYVKSVLALIDAVEVRSIAHITGGGIAANVSRVLPPGVGLSLDRSAWREPGIFQWIRDSGGIDDAEMLKTFNCGLGMVIIVAESELARALAHFEASGIGAWEIGRAEARAGETVVIHG
ncbi:MAG: phosphoribosylformylglycinamidine cyclo-ligase [Gammaproteobacteria bacterium]|nr:phosphoribosylformylglycinamidine cyclo-ligase [Gammaproteobacteria bacterium]